MISRSEADDLISKWASEGTRLRVDLLMGDTNFSVEGSLEPAAAGIVRVHLRDAGFIEFLLDDSWGFEYFDPNVIGIPAIDRLGRSHNDAVQETGAGIVGYQPPSFRLFMLEIVR